MSIWRTSRNPVTEVMLTVAGTERRVLAAVSSATAKQASLGGAITITAALAVVSATIALVTAFDLALPFALAGGALWGVAILNLDRWLVISSPRQSDKRWTVAMALPRVLLAILIGLVVSTPLTLLVFRAEIETQLSVMQADKNATFEKQLLEDPRYTSLPADKKRISELQSLIASGVSADAVVDDPTVKDATARLAATEKEYSQAERDVACEKEGTCGSGRAGVGPASADKEARRDRLAAEVTSLRSELAAAKTAALAHAQETVASRMADWKTELATRQSTVAGIEKQRAAEVAAHEGAVAHSDGLLARLEALHQLSENNESMRLAHGCLFLFLTVLECVPVLFKTLLSLGEPNSYEKALSIHEGEELARLRLQLKTQRAEADTVAKAALAATRAQCKVQRRSEAAAAKVVLDAQLELTRYAVDKWTADQTEVLATEVDGWLRQLGSAEVGVFGRVPRQRSSGESDQQAVIEVSERSPFQAVVPVPATAAPPHSTPAPAAQPQPTTPGVDLRKYPSF